MNKICTKGLFLVVLGLSGCGGSDFDGVYLAKGTYGSPDVALSLDGDSAQAIVIDKTSSEVIGQPTYFKVEVKNDVLLLDSTNGDLNLSFKRADDQRGLTCLNCRETRPRFVSDWHFVKDEPLDIENIMDEQNERIQTARKAEQELKEKSASLEKFKGDWVSQRKYKDDSLLITSISTVSGVNTYAFNYSSGAKMVEYTNDFEVSGNKMIRKFKDGASMEHVLDETGNKLICVSCKDKTVYLKADSDRINDISYARTLAGDPQQNSWD